MEPYEVKITKVTDALGFDPVTLNPLRNKVVTFTVGNNGPFNVTFTAADYNADNVNAAIKREVDILKAIGATS